jgi:glycosyltransferase involved in cell wall biosynthesis
VRFSIITANYNGGAFLEKTILSILAQKHPSFELEYIVVDGKSTDNSPDIIRGHAEEIDCCIVEADTGPANAINKGFAAATGDIVSWLNADDLYFQGTLLRVKHTMTRDPGAAFCFGRCKIIDRRDNEIRKSITRFKELFFPFSSRFTFQCINYISQPALFFRRSAMQKAGFLDEKLVAAWDYDYFLRLWHQGQGIRVKGPPLAAFRWHEESIGSNNFHVQFKEELISAVNDAGFFSMQACLHHFVRWAIVGIYAFMQKQRK